MLAAGSLLVVGHALYLYASTGWHWSRSDMDNSSGYQIVEIMCIIELLVGGMTLACALYPTPLRFKVARIVLTPVLIALTCIYVFASSQAAATSDNVRPLLVALSGDANADSHIHETGWYLENALMPMAIFFLGTMAVLASGSIYQPKKRLAGTELPTPKNPPMTRWLVVTVGIVSGMVAAMHATNLSRFYPSESYVKQVQQWVKDGTALYSQQTNGVSALCYQNNDNDYPMRLDRRDSALLLYDANITLVEWRLPAGRVQSYTNTPLFPSYANLSAYNLAVSVRDGPFIDCRLRRDTDNRNQFFFNLQGDMDLVQQPIINDDDDDDNDGTTVTDLPLAKLTAVVYTLSSDNWQIVATTKTFTPIDESTPLDFSDLTITFNVSQSSSLIAQRDVIAATPQSYVNKNVGGAAALALLASLCFIPPAIIALWWIGLKGRFTTTQVAAWKKSSRVLPLYARAVGASIDDLVREVPTNMLNTSSNKGLGSASSSGGSSPVTSTPPSPNLMMVSLVTNQSANIGHQSSSSNLLHGEPSSPLSSSASSHHDAPLSPIAMDHHDATAFQALPAEPLTPTPVTASSSVAAVQQDSHGAVMVEVKVNSDDIDHNSIVIPSPDVSNLSESLTSA